MSLFAVYGILVLGHASCRCRSTKSKFTAFQNDIKPQKPEELQNAFSFVASEFSDITHTLQDKVSII